MKPNLAVFGLFIGGLLLSSQAQAQTDDNRLRGINQFNLMIQALQASGEDWKECQITVPLIRDAFMFPTSGARFVVNERLDIQDQKFRAPFMYIDVGTRSDQLCVSPIDMRLLVGQEVKLEASGRNILAPILLWTFRAMRSSAKDRHGQVVREAIDLGTKKFITDWNLDNK